MIIILVESNINGGGRMGEKHKFTSCMCVRHDSCW